MKIVDLMRLTEHAQNLVSTPRYRKVLIVYESSNSRVVPAHWKQRVGPLLEKLSMQSDRRRFRQAGEGRDGWRNAGYYAAATTRETQQKHPKKRSAAVSVPL